MKQKAILIIALMALVSMVITPISAETFTGTWGSGGVFNQTTCAFAASGGGTDSTNATYMILYNTEYLTPLVSVVRWDAGTGGNDNVKFKVDNPSTSGEATNFVGYIGTTEVVTGTIGYQRYWNSIGVEEIGYQYVVFNTWNLTGFTGTQYLNMSYNHANIHWMYYDGFGDCYAPLVGYTAFRMGFTIPNGNNDVRGTYSWLKYDSFTHSYTITSPSGLGISGSVDKQGYSSKIYVVNANTRVPIISEYSVSTVNYNFTTLTQPIYFSAYSSLGQWYNSSVLFAAVTPAPTTTIPPTPAPTVAPGYVRNTFVTIDGTTYSTIHGSNIMLYDVEAGVWSNSTSDADGSFYIDTLPYHTINAYATFTVFEDHYADASIMGAETGYSGMDYPIYMYPPGLSPGSGNINLYITVVDADTTYAIGSANVQVELPTGAIDGTTTGSGGSAATFIVPNNTVIKARATKSGYGAVTESFNSGETSPKTKTLSMRKLLVTIAPTSTIPPGGVTPAITVIPGCEDPNSAGCSRAQDAAMMKQLRDAGPSLIGLCIIVMFMGLVKMLGK